MKRYNKYKPSGIEWLGDIPEHWEVKRVKDILSNTKYPIKTGPFGSQLKGDDLKDEGVVCVYSQRNVIDNQFEEFKYFVDSNKAIELSAFKVKANDILITTRGTIGRASLLSDKCKIGILHPCLIALRINKKLVNYNFFLYYLNDSGVFQKYIASESNATTIEVIYSNTLNVFIKIIPPLSEQTAIANYLDTKTAAIDRKIELLTAKADKYKALRRSLINETVCRGLNPNVSLKDSGIESIGMIPEHWEVKRVKDLLYLLTGNSISDKTDFEDSNNSIPYVATKDIEINSCKIDYENGIYIPKNELKNFKPINPNSILLCIEGGSAGKKIAFNTRRICFVNKLCSFSSKGNAVDIKYNFYQMQSAPWLFQFNQVLNGLIGGVSISLLKTFRLITPPRNEQAEIAIYLDNKTTQIDTILTNIGEQINKLTQLRKTLINDVVTGKIKVTGRELI